MRLIDARTGIEVLSREECLVRLRQDLVGRLAVVDGDAAALLPVNYAMDGETVVFRSAPGTKLAAAGRAKASFEIDEFDRASRSGWSVVVSGRLEEVEAHGRLRHLHDLPLDPWAPGERSHWLRLVPERITGRVVHRPAGRI